jgi:Fur family ferric uptake transcriptional regulator
MPSTKAENLLSEFNLRHTAQRISILTAFFNNNHALSHTDLESEFEGQIDRATIYRCLKQFLEVGIVHRIPDEQFQTKYAVCSSCEHHDHNHDHVHFNCQNCNQTTCIENVFIPNISLPKGFTAKEKILTIQGLCNFCNKTD